MDDVESGYRPVKRLAAIIGALALLAGGCSARDESEPPLRPVSLPDLSKMTESVQKQIREAHGSLTKTLEKRGAAPAEVADAYGTLGRIFLAADQSDNAEPCLLNAQTLAPSDIRWPYYLGHLNRDRGQLAAAAAFFERALELRPDDLASLVWLGDIHLALGRPDDAEPRFAKALALEPKSLSARFGLGRTALAKQDYAGAVTHLEGVLAQDPEAAAAHYPLAMAYRGLGKLDKADVHLRQREDHVILPADPLMVELDELLESPQAYESRGIRALDRKDWTEAATLFRNGLKIAPDNAALHHRLGTALYLMGDGAGARKEFESAVQASPDYHLAQYSLGVLLQAEGHHADAIDRFTAALRSRPGDTAARVRLAASLRRTGRAKDALSHYEQVVVMKPDLTEARFGQAIALVQVGRYREARDRLTEGMKTGADPSLFAHGLARVLATARDDRIRDGQRAMTLVQDLLKQGRTLDLGATMAMALAELGQFAQAAAVQRDLLAAAEQAGLRDMASRLTANLALYERGEPCRTPWTADEVP
jgi:tetratricopeptide (TPR) repeat protein